MFENIITVGCFDTLHKEHINFLENIKGMSKKIIVGLHDNNIINSYESRKKSLEKYVDDTFIINNEDPSKIIQGYILKHLFEEKNKIHIGSSVTNTKIIDNDYKGGIVFTHNTNAKFIYKYNDNKIIITRIDKKCGWSEDLLGYKKNIGVVLPKGNSLYKKDDKNKLYTCLKKLKINIKEVEPILTYKYDYLEKYDSMKIDWVVGWINPDCKKRFRSSHNIQRLRDNNELLYFLKSVYKYANWINKIYIILALDSKPPIWFKENDKIVLIQETSLYKNVQRNSETKKLFYGRIPNISDLFIAGDDDYLLGDYIYKSEFFTWNRIPIVNHVNCDAGGAAHIPIAWARDSYNKSIANINYKYYLNMNNNRDNPWTPIKNYLLRKRKILNGKKKSPDLWINDTTINFNHKLYLIIKYNYKYICINDDWSTRNHKLYAEQRAILNGFYQTFLPGNYEFIKN